jgi:nucleotide-binding universal stress UspA family protein
MERALVCVDNSANGQLAASLAGVFAGRQQVLATIMEVSAGREEDAGSGRQLLAQAATLALGRTPVSSDGEATSTRQISLQELVQSKSADTDDAVEKEAVKGYSIAFVGTARPLSATTNRFEGQLQRLVEAFDGPFAIGFNAARPTGKLGGPLNILVPTGGTPEARLATEIALSLAGASDGMLTALHVFDPQDDTALLRGRARRQGLSVLVDVRRLGKRSGVPVKGITLTHSRPEAAIARTAQLGRYDLVVVGTALRQGEARFLGPRSSALLRALRSPVLLIAR